MHPVLALAALAVGAAVAVRSTDRLLAGLVGLARYLPVSVFAAGALLSGFEVENAGLGTDDLVSSSTRAMGPAGT